MAWAGVVNVLSLFDGMSCGMIALQRAGIHVNNYYASEIDKHAIKVSRDNYPNIQHVGDITKLNYKDGVLYNENNSISVGKIDLVIGGSPCQSISGLGKQEGLEGSSGLFFHYLRLLKETKADYFLLENVVGKKVALDEITKLMDIQPNLINASLFTGQNRKRLYWTNIEYSLDIKDKNILLKDCLETNPSVSSIVSQARKKWLIGVSGKNAILKKYVTIDGEKAGCLTARSDASWNGNYVTREGEITKLSVEEYEKLQTVPAGYTACVSDSQRYKMLGNGWCVDVIAHIFKGLKNDNLRE